MSAADCHFCGSRSEHPSEWKTVKPVPLGDLGDGQGFQAVDTWIACERCDEILASGDQAAVVARLEKFSQSTGVAEETDWLPGVMTGLVAEMYENGLRRVGDPRARRALTAGRKAVADWYAGNLARGGVCDFCLGPIERETIWATDRDLSVTVSVLGEKEAIPYGRSWACCPDCDPIVEAAVQSGDVAALAARCWDGRAQDGNSALNARVRAELTLGEHDAWVEQTRLDLERLMRLLVENGLHRLVFAAGKESDIPVAPDDGRPAAGWQRALDAQMDLWAHSVSPVGQAFLRSWAKLETEKRPTARTLYEKLLRVEAGKLLGASPVYVDAEMCALIDSARQSFRLEKMIPEDLLIASAFVYFETPLYLQDRNGLTVNVRAFSYSPLLVEGESGVEKQGIALTLYSTTLPGLADQDIGVPKIVEYRRGALAKLGLDESLPELVVLHVCPVLFNEDPRDDLVDVDDGRDTGGEQWWSLVQVTFRMMMERVSLAEKRRPDRWVRKRAARQKFNVSHVIVVRLRRKRPPRDADEDTGGSREYSHRWLVTGHWRDQWYPSLATHRQRWIAGYVKGPEDKPLVAKRKAYQWDR